VNVWCGVLGNKLIRTFVFDNNLTGNTYEAYLRNEIPGLLEDIPLMIKCTSNMMGLPTLHSARETLLK